MSGGNEAADLRARSTYSVVGARVSGAEPYAAAAAALLMSMEAAISGAEDKGPDLFCEQRRRERY